MLQQLKDIPVQSSPAVLRGRVGITDQTYIQKGCRSLFLHLPTTIMFQSFSVNGVSNLRKGYKSTDLKPATSRKYLVSWGNKNLIGWDSEVSVNSFPFVCQTLKFTFTTWFIPSISGNVNLMIFSPLPELISLMRAQAYPQ
jgi:hypothetical protein